MATFSDMVTLLLTFFVMLVAMSEVEVKKFKEALSYFHGNTGLLQHDAVQPTMRRQDQNKVLSRRQAEQYERLIAYLQENGLEDKVEVELTTEGIHAVMTDSVMFRSGRAELIEPSRTILRMMADLLSAEIAAVVVEGHTDDQPITTALFPSNWELSAARATSVVRFLLEQPRALPPARYSALGHGEHRPVAATATAEGRARNRRVEILFSWDVPDADTDLPPLLAPPSPPPAWETRP